jgi:hypothetical protein
MVETEGYKFEEEAAAPAVTPGDVFMMNNKRMTYVAALDQQVVLMGEQPRNKHIAPAEVRMSLEELQQKVTSGAIQKVLKKTGIELDVNGNRLD